MTDLMRLPLYMRRPNAQTYGIKLYFNAILNLELIDGNKTKMLRPRPVKQQQECITEKTLLQHAFLLSKNNLLQKTSKK